MTAGSHTLRPADRRDMDIPLLPNETADQYKNLGKEFPGGDRYPGFTGFLAARMAAYYGYHMTGVVDPIEDFDVIELHDAFTISDVQTYEDIGITAVRPRPRLTSSPATATTPTRTPASRASCRQPLRRPDRLHARGGSQRHHAGVRDRHPSLGPVGRDPRRREALEGVRPGRSRTTGPTCRSRAPSGPSRSATRAWART